MSGISRSIARPVARPLSSPLAGGGGGGLLDFLPPALRTGGLALGTSRLFSSYTGPLIRLRRGSDSVEQDVGSGSTRVTSADVTGLCGKNLLKWSEDLTQVGWTKSRCTPSLESGYSKVTASETNVNGMPVSQSAGAVTASNRTVRFKTKKGSGDYCLVTAFDGSANGCRQWFNLAAGTVASTNTLGSGWIKTGATIAPDAGGGYLCTFSFTAPTANMNLVLYASASSDLGYGCTVGDIGYLTDIQLEYGSTATAYEARGATGASPCYVPKLYDQLGSNDAIQNTGTQQPQIIPRQIGELPILVGDMVDDFLSVAGFMPTLNGKDITVIQAGKNALCGNSTAPRLYVGLGAGSSYDLLNNLAHGNSGNRRVLTLRSEGAAQSARINGVEAATATQPQIATYGGTDFLLARAGSAFGNPPQSNLVFPSALDLTTLAAIEAKLMTEYSITP